MPRLSFIPINNKVPDSIRSTIHKFVAANGGKRLFIEYGQYKDKRTLQQNNFYKGVMVPAFAEFMREYGNVISEDQADLVIKDGVGYVAEITLPDGRVQRVPKSTKDLDKDAMSAFITQVLAWALTDWNCELPIPDEGKYFAGATADNREAAHG